MATVRVRMAALLNSYTGGLNVIEIDAGNLGEVLHALDRRFPGLAFRVVDEQGRIRPHMNVFLGEEKVQDLGTTLVSGNEIYIVGALSGG
jgi:sulfur-carrier protein